MTRQLGIFAKYWQPGVVKTRLAAGIGAPAAAQVHRACVAALAARFGQTADRRVLCVAPPERAAAFRELAGRQWLVTAQCAGDLGQRMRHYFEQSFATGAGHVVLIGADSPTLPAAYLDEAFDRLGDTSVVLGPSDDGGYYLIGLSCPPPEVFRDIAWGTADVWRQTLDRLQSAGERFHALPPWYDIDTAADLARLLSELAGPLRDDELWRPLRESVEAALTGNSIKPRN